MNTLNYSAGCDWAWGGDRAGKHGGGAGNGIPRAPPPPIVSCSASSAMLTAVGLAKAKQDWVDGG